MQRKYLRVTPTTEPLEPEGIPRVLESMHKLTSTETTGWKEQLNPFHSQTPPQFEFLALSEGADEPVAFYYGVDEHLDTLEKRLQSIYPASFDIEHVDLDLEARLVRPVEYSRAEFREQVAAGNLQYEFGPDDRYERTTADDEGESPDGHEDTHAEGGHRRDFDSDRFVDVDESVLELAPPEDLPAEDSTALEKPTLTPDGTILARPAPDTRTPLGVEWHGAANRRQDWMTSLTPFTAEDTDESLPSVDEPGDALASLIEHLMAATAPVAFQVVFQRRPDWAADADVRKQDLLEGRDTLFQKLLAAIVGIEEHENGQQLEDLRASVARRIECIELKNAKRSFTANVRAIGIPAESDTDGELDARMDALASVFDLLDGPYYEVRGSRLRSKGFRETAGEQHATETLQRILDRELTTGRGRTRPDLVLGGKELAHFVLVPSSEQLTVEGTRGTRAEQQSRNPLPQPHPDLLGAFDSGMSIGYPLDENAIPRSDPVRIPPTLLTMHYGRFASTGSGKSKAIINDALSLRATTGGPVVIVDPKGDGMCENYLRCHYARFGDLDDVYRFRVPETLPAFSFFDIRAALDAGRTREEAVQDKVDHFHDILRMIMGRERYDQAFVANEILSYLIKALFDAEYGSDVFGLDDLFEAALQMQREQTIPPVSAANQTVEESLTRHFAKEDHRFQVSMDAVGNRLDKLREDASLRRIFSHVPDRDDSGAYVDTHFDFRAFLDEDATILFDLGDLRPEAQRAITLLLLSNLWDAVQVRRRDGQTDYEKLTNLIIEEAAPVASTSLVSEQLLPQGRSFGLSMGLVMQFPGQVRNRSERAYDEVLNNIKTKLIGNISIEDALAESLAHEDLDPIELRNRINTLPSGEWIAQLPSPSFGETGPAPFSVKPLPIAPGHPESDEPLAAAEEDHFETVALPQLAERTQTQYGLGAATASNPDSDAPDWGSAGAETTATAQSGTAESDATHSAFIGHATSDTCSSVDEETDFEHGQTSPENQQTDPEHEQTDPEQELEETQPDITALFGGSNDDEETQEGQRAPSETVSPPVQAREVPVPDDELQTRGLSHDDIRFLSRVLDVMNREDAEYTLLDSMRALRDEYETLHLDRLKEQCLLEETAAAGQKYYTVLPAGRELLGRKLQVGPGQGDIGEKTPHKVGVCLLERWLQQRDDVARVEPYYAYDDETVFDVAGFDDDEVLVWVGEAELPSNNSHAPVADFDKLSAVDADAIWAFDTRQTVLEVLDRLADADRIDESVSGRAARSFATIRDAVDDLDAAGLTTVRGFTNLKDEVDT